VKLSVHPYFLTFYRPFVLAHGTRKGTQLAILKLEHEGITAYGEASLPPYYPETLASVTEWVMKQQDSVADLLKVNPFLHQDLIPYDSAHPAASAALQSLVLNWYAKANNLRLEELFDLAPAHPGLTLTFTKTDYDYLIEKLKTAQDFTHMKLKLTGDSDDLEFVQAIRKRTELPFCIDFNQGYPRKEKAILMIQDLMKMGCELMEQPLNAQDHEGHHWLKQRLEIPIIADESIRTYEDLLEYHEAYSGVNVKLMKCGGLFQGKRMLEFKSTDTSRPFLNVLGCMSESSLGVGTASVIAPLTSLADLDAPYLNSNDPFEGFQIHSGKIEREKEITLKKGVLLDS
jgi:L-alanine-DL-glutamate epimerase-like enolase superfamily enzyme